MIGKFGSDQQQLADLGGGVISEDGATLLSGESTGEASLLFGPAALREIQSNVANGDFSIPPADAEATITADNALPYWTGVQTGTAPTVSAAITASAVTASQSALTFTAAAGAATNSAYTFTRYVPIAGNANRSSAYHPELYSVTTTGGATDKTRVRITLTATALDSDFSALTVTATANETASTLTSKSLFTNWIVPDAKAAYILVSVKVDVPATAPVGAVTVVIGEVRVARSEGSIAFPALQNPSGQPWIIENDNLIFEVYPQTELDPTFTMESNASTSNYNINLTANNANGVVAIYGGGYADISGGFVDINADTNVNLTAPSGVSVSDSIGIGGSLYGASDLTGVRIVRGGTNSRLWIHSSPAADVAASTATTVSGVLVTKPTSGQPSTNINGTATTDAFADALRNGGIAVDTTNNRGYFYSNGWKYANLTTPSDSRLKQEITEITGALDTLRQLVPVAFKWKAPEAHGRTDAVADDGKRLGFIADQVATTDLAHWVETLGVDEREAHLVDTTEVLAVNIPQNEMEALVVQALLDIDTRLKALESR